MSDSPETSPSQSPPQISSSDADSAGQPSAPPSPPKSPPPASASAPPPESVSSTPPPSKPSSPPPSPPAENNPPPSESSTPTTEQQNNPPTSSSSTSQEKPSPSSSSPQSSSPSPTTSTSSSSPKSQTNSASAPQQSSTADPKAAPGQQSPQTPTGSPTSPPLIIAPTNSSSSISQGTPGLTPSSTSTKAPSPTAGHTTQTSKDSEQDGKRYGAAVGATVGFVCLVAFVVLICAARRRKKRREQFYIPQQNQTVQSDAYHPGAQQGTGVHSGSSESGYYSSQIYNSSCSGGSQSGPNNFPGGPIESTVFGGSKAYFSYEELMEITGGFSRQNILGEGGFGCVYKGWLLDGKAVAVKQLKAGSGQGDREFKAEVEIISRVHHRHLVSLVGYCISEQHRLLIYEFVPNKTLEHHLHGGGTAVLEWTKRVKIALGSAKGLSYLHEDCHPKIIHRDIKSANILLDDAFEAQVADFGLARLNDTSQTHVSTRVMGTFGYLAPEYAASGKLTDRSDVFSFGVVLLELITGRKPVDPNQPLGDESLVEWARPHLINAIESGDFSELADPRLAKQYVEREMLRMIEVAAACVRHSAAKRPRMAQVVRALDMEGEVSDLSNGVKFGQSTAYDSGQYSQDIMRFRQLALGSDTSSEYNMNSGGYSSHGFTNSDSETRAINPTYRESS